MVNTDNLKQLVAFYSQVFGKDPDWQDDGYAGFETGGLYFMIGSHDKIKGKSRDSHRLLLNFTTSDVNGEFKRLKPLASAVIAEPYSMDQDQSGMTIATLADPDGNYFQLMTPMDDKAN
ncbi:hypothetical protein A2W24_00050 [Microgenomates group bacterium RBG_16_45_19]|nr:MAG: hypothetical protein A2W24_00050 [Microgenomates group bacterium RBG_16_45_19]